MLLLAGVGELRFGSPATSWPLKTYDPPDGLSSMPSTFSSVDLPQPGRAHDRDELAVGDVEVDLSSAVVSTMSVR